MPTVYKTGHQIADTVAEAFRPLGYEFRDTKQGSYQSDCHIAYGILRGTAEQFYRARNRGEKFIFLDKGFLRPNHFDGYYRFGINAFQQRYEPHAFDRSRLDQILGSEPIMKHNLFTSKGSEILVIPPTEHVAMFYNLGSARIWLQTMLADLAEITERPVRVRFKSSQTDLEDHLDRAYCVVTHSSSVAWEALRRGIPAIGAKGSIVHDWNGLSIQDIDRDDMRIDSEQVIRLLVFMANHQFTLNEIKRGEANHLIEGFNEIIHREHLEAA